MRTFITLIVFVLGASSSAFARTCLCNQPYTNCDSANCTIYDANVYHACRVDGGFHDPWGLCPNSAVSSNPPIGATTTLPSDTLTRSLDNTLLKVQKSKDTIYVTPKKMEREEIRNSR